MVIVVHQNVVYHSSLLAGSEPVDVAVYDSVQLRNSAHEDGEALFVEADTQSIKVTQFFVLSNLSEPPRTFLGASTFDFVLPNNAVLDSLAAQPAGSSGDEPALGGHLRLPCCLSTVLPWTLPSNIHAFVKGN